MTIEKPILIIEILALLIMIIGVLVIFIRVLRDTGFSTMTIQFVSLTLVFPIILILALEGIIKGEVVSTLIGSLSGYLFSDFGKKRKNNKKTKQEKHSAYN